MQLEKLNGAHIILNSFSNDNCPSFLAIYDGFHMATLRGKISKFIQWYPSWSELWDRALGCKQFSFSTPIITSRFFFDFDYEGCQMKKNDMSTHKSILVLEISAK